MCTKEFSLNYLIPPPPQFIACRHTPSPDELCYECLQRCLRERYIYRFHEEKCCWKKSDKLGHDRYGTDGYYRVQRPVFGHKCYSQYDEQQQTKIVQLMDMLSIECSCRTGYSCQVCNYLNCNSARESPKLFVREGLIMDLETCMALIPFLNIVQPTQ